MKTFWLDFRYPQQAIAGEYVSPLKFSDLVLDLNYFLFFHPNPYPNSTYLPKHEFVSPNNQFYQRIWYVEHSSVNAYMV